MSTPNYSIHAYLISALAVITVLVHCSPILNRPVFFIFLSLFTGLFTSFRLNRPIFRKYRKLIVLLIFYVFLTILYRIIGKSDGYWGNSMHEYSFFVSFIVFLLVIDGLSNKQIKFIYWPMIVIATVNVIDNIYLYNLYPQLAGEQYFMEEDFLSSINAGGTSFYTFCLFLFNIFFFVFLNSSDKKLKRLFICLSIITAIYIFGFCGKGSIVVYTLLSIPLQYFAFKTKRPSLFLFVGGFWGLFFLLFVSFFSEEIVNLILSISPIERVSVRLITLIDNDSVYANEYTVTGRTTLYLLSLKTWVSNFENFLFGIGDIRADIGAAATGIGQHSEFFDSLARYGLIGGLFLYSILKRFFNSIFSFFDQKYRFQLYIILGIIILCGCTKKLFMPNIGAVLFIILPLTAKLANPKSNF